MSMVTFKIMWHMKNQKNLNFHGRRQSTDAIPEITKMLEISDKVAIIQML